MKLIMLYLALWGLLGLFSSIDIQAQSCRDYEKKCPDIPKYFKGSSLSRSLTIRKMKKIKFSTTFYGGRTYNIAVCGKSKLGNLHIRLVSDDEYRIVLYDNAADNFATEKNFEFGETVNVMIEISAPHYFNENEFECAGINISYKNLAG